MVIALKAVLDHEYAPNLARCGSVGSELRVSEPVPLDTLTMRCVQQVIHEGGQHRLRYGNDAKHVGLKYRAHLVERRDAWAAQLHDLFEQSAVRASNLQPIFRRVRLLAFIAESATRVSPALVLSHDPASSRLTNRAEHCYTHFKTSAYTLEDRN